MTLKEAENHYGKKYYVYSLKNNCNICSNMQAIDTILFITLKQNIY